MELRSVCLHVCSQFCTQLTQNCLTSRDLGVGNDTSLQLAPDNNRMLENMQVGLHDTNAKVKRNKLQSVAARMISVERKVISKDESIYLLRSKTR